MRLYLVRHPQPIVAPDTCYGSTDLVVAPEEHERVLRALLPSLPADAPLFSSPLLRCSGLAERLAAVRGGVAVQFDARLVEMDFGAWESRAWSDIPRAEIDAWAEDVADYRPGGGESVMQMARRVRAFHDEVTLLRQDCVVICHAGTIRMLLACRLDFSPAELARYVMESQYKIEYGDVVICEALQSSRDDRI